MSMGTGHWVKKLTDEGACNGIDARKCKAALVKMIDLPDGDAAVSAAKRIMGDEYETWRVQYKTAWKRLEERLEERRAASSQTSEEVNWGTMDDNID